MGKIIIAALAILFSVGCIGSTDDHSAGIDSNTVKGKDQGIKELKIIVDTLNNVEQQILEKLSLENEFIVVSKNVERLYAPGKTIPELSRLIFSKEFLNKKGYHSFQCKGYGMFTDMNLVYSFDMGQASTGFGSVTGIDSQNYIHTSRSCGLTKCITNVYRNGTKIFEKED